MFAGFASSCLFLASGSSFGSTALDTLGARSLLVSAGLFGSGTLSDSEFTSAFASVGIEDFSATDLGFSDLASSFLAVSSYCFGSFAAFS